MQITILKILEKDGGNKKNETSSSVNIIQWLEPELNYKHFWAV